MENVSGYWPIEDRVLVKPVVMEEKTAGGIVLAQDTKATEDMASMHGTLVAAARSKRSRLAKSYGGSRNIYGGHIPRTGIRRSG